MRILLVAPRFHSRWFWDFRKLSDVLGRTSASLPLALPTVASLTPRQHEVVICDDHLDDIPYDGSWDLVGLTGMTCYVNRAYEIADEFRRRGVPVVFGGPHATLAPYETLEHADAVVIGEAEGVWEALLADFEAGELKEVYRGVDARPDLTASRPPDWQAAHGERYVFFGVEATRGCPFDCHFCSIKQIYGDGFRTRTVQDVLDEIDRAPSNQIFFTDDNLIGNKPFVKALMMGLKGKNASWGCQMSLNVAFMPEMLKLMQDAGCFFVFVGFESLEAEAIATFGKDVNKRDYAQAIRNIQAHGMHVIGSFIVGTDFDRKDAFAKIRDFTREVSLSWVMVNIVNSPPGTRLIRDMEAADRNRVFSYDELDGAHATVEHPHLSREEIEEGFRWLYREVYDWDSLRLRLGASLAQGEWRQNSMTLHPKEQARIAWRLLSEYVLHGSWAQRRFFFAMVLRVGRRVNLDSIVNVLLLALNWNHFAFDLRARQAPVGEPIRFRPEYLVPVEQQVIGRGAGEAGVPRAVPRMVRRPGGSTPAAVA